MSTTPRIADLAGRAMSALENGQADHALVIAHLVAAQQQKVANIVQYLNSDTSTWAAEDEAVVRQYLGLTPGLVADEPEVDEVPADEEPPAEDVSFDEDLHA